MGSKPHSASQVEALPSRASVVQKSLSLQLVGQVPAGSQVSPNSKRLFPQKAEQLLSLVLSQPGAQQSSLSVHTKIASLKQTASQVAALPKRTSAVQAFKSSQLVGQVLIGSQVSPASMISLPQK